MHADNVNQKAGYNPLMVTWVAKSGAVDGTQCDSKVLPKLNQCASLCTTEPQSAAVVVLHLTLLLHFKAGETHKQARYNWSGS